MNPNSFESIYISFVEASCLPKSEESKQKFEVISRKLRYFFGMHVSPEQLSSGCKFIEKAESTRMWMDNYKEVFMTLGVGGLSYAAFSGNIENVGITAGGMAFLSLILGIIKNTQELQELQRQKFIEWVIRSHTPPEQS